MDIVVTDTKTQAEYFEKEFQIEQEKVKVIYLSPNRKECYKSKEKKVLQEKEDAYVVLWFGTILPLQRVDVVLKATQYLTSNTHIVFYIIGDLSKLKIQKVNYPNVRFIN